ncbi:MAG: GAF domain-containing protein, partial [Chloroflexota bacterium]
MAISRELDLDQTLQHIVDSARQLAAARYAALGVFSSDRELERFVFSGLTPEEAEKIDRYPTGLGLLGAVLYEKGPIRIASIRDDPRSVGFPANHPEMTSFLGLPIRAGEEVLGNLYLADKTDALEFEEADAELMAIFA